MIWLFVGLIMGGYPVDKYYAYNNPQSCIHTDGVPFFNIPSSEYGIYIISYVPCEGKND